VRIDTDLHAEIPVVYNYERCKMRRTSVITYARVSTKKQAKDGVSLADQTRQLEAFAAAHQLQSYGDFSDVGSGLSEEEGSKRDNFNEACRLALRNDWDILVTVPSRFTRTLEAYDRFVAKGGRLICANLGIDAAEQIRSHLQAEIVQHEQRQRLAMDGQERARAEGRSAGNPNLAPAREKSLETRVVNALQGYGEFERQLEIARANGAKTPKAIAAAFNKAGFKTPQGRRWKEGNVRRNLKAIAELKAFSALLDATETVPIGNDNVEQPASSGAACAAGPQIAAQAGYPLSPDELAELREMLEGSLTPAEKIEGLIRSASDPALTLEGRAKIMNWMTKKRAA
jgi:DNA invertase Pin-like site-specific DNA recombinase